MAKAELYCWKCAADLAEVLLPFERLSKCRACNADLHVCRMCSYYDTGVSNSCREPIAEKVVDKKRANFCGYFQPREHSHAQGSAGTKANEQVLASLFGLEQGDAESSTGDADRAKQELDALFGLKDNKKD